MHSGKRSRRIPDLDISAVGFGRTKRRRQTAVFSLSLLPTMLSMNNKPIISADR
ncbi:hypothetical protein M5D96_001776 [Drosophila gunungcola]|uniref:Uncharacterized protein n=1 Tax=Drosophila gunungcola TaxID=103775 RepID=A0A9P9YYT6_9MUSC|nr:hypothetical protein M5D96_001776 [Drosophila gunungcola]